MLLRDPPKLELLNKGLLVSGGETIVVSKLHQASCFFKTVRGMAQAREQSGNDTLRVREGGLAPGQQVGIFGGFAMISLKACGVSQAQAKASVMALCRLDAWLLTFPKA